MGDLLNEHVEVEVVAGQRGLDGVAVADLSTEQNREVRDLLVKPERDQLYIVDGLAEPLEEVMSEVVGLVLVVRIDGELIGSPAELASGFVVGGNERVGRIRGVDPDVVHHLHIVPAEKVDGLVIGLVKRGDRCRLVDEPVMPVMECGLPIGGDEELPEVGIGGDLYRFECGYVGR